MSVSGCTVPSPIEQLEAALHKHDRARRGGGVVVAEILRYIFQVSPLSLLLSRK